MSNSTDIIKLVEEQIIEVRGKHVLLDSTVAELYGVETRDLAIIETFTKIRTIGGAA